MKKLTLIVLASSGLALGLSSCSGSSTLTKDIKRMDVRFEPLTRADYTLVGNLQTESVITGMMTKKGRALDTEFTSNVKKGVISKAEAVEIMYFAPKPGESITGSLYENEVFNMVYGPSGPTATTKTYFQKLKESLTKVKFVQQSDPGMDRAYFMLVEKYPDIDYFINVRFDRNVVLQGSKFTETIIIKADGVQLRTDI